MSRDGSEEPDELARSRVLAGVELELPEHGTGIRAARRAAKEPAPASGPTRRWMTGFAAALGAALLVGGALTFVGVQTLRDSSTGRRVASVDPSEPGFEGILETTPTLLVVHQHDGALVSAALLALANDDAGGSVILLPPSVKVGDGADAATLAVTYAFGGTPEVMRGAGEAVAGVGVEDIVVVDDARWADLLRPVGSITIENPDDVPGFPVGTVSLGADQVGAWLEAHSSNEGELAQVYRQQLFWEAWIKAVAASSDPAVVPGELDSGLGRFVRGLAHGRLQVTTVPVTDVVDEAGNHVFPDDRAALERVITDLVPFPTGTELAPRTRVRLLDGTGDQQHVRQVAPTVVASTSTIVVVGNADAFDYGTTEIRYHQPGQRAAAERLRAALGVGRVIEDIRPIDSFDVTIVLGTDI